MLPFSCRSSVLRDVLLKMERSGHNGSRRGGRHHHSLLHHAGHGHTTDHHENDDFKTIVALSNQIDRVLPHFSAQDQETIQAALCNAVLYISQLKARVHAPAPAPAPAPIEPALPPSQELTNMTRENEELKKHIESLERQLGHVKADREKISAANRAVVAQHSKDMTALRANLTKLKSEAEEVKKQCFEKERAYQTVFTQLCSAQDDIKRLKIESRVETANHVKLMNENTNLNATLDAGNSLNLDNFHTLDNNISSSTFIGYGTSKYGFEEVMSLRATNDALRVELNKERTQRSTDRISTHSTLNTAKAKATYSDKMIGDLREHVDLERRRCAAAEEEQHRLQLQAQQLEFEVSRLDSKKRESELEASRYRDKCTLLQQDYDSLLKAKTAGDAEWSERCTDLTNTMRALRVGVSELQSEISTLASKGGDEMQKLAADKTRITLRLESLLNENDHLWSSSQLQDKQLRRSSDIITSLSSKLYTGGVSTTSSVSADTDQFLTAGRKEQLVKELELTIEEKWARRLATETQQLVLQVQDVTAQLETAHTQLATEKASKSTLEQEMARDSMEMAQQIMSMEQRFQLLVAENNALRDTHDTLHAHTSSQQHHHSTKSNRMRTVTQGLGQLMDTHAATAQQTENLIQSMIHSLSQYEHTHPHVANSHTDDADHELVKILTRGLQLVHTNTVSEAEYTQQQGLQLQAARAQLTGVKSELEATLHQLHAVRLEKESLAQEMQASVQDTGVLQQQLQQLQYQLQTHMHAATSSSTHMGAHAHTLPQVRQQSPGRNSSVGGGGGAHRSESQQTLDMNLSSSSDSDTSTSTHTSSSSSSDTDNDNDDANRLLNTSNMSARSVHTSRSAHTHTSARSGGGVSAHSARSGSSVKRVELDDQLRYYAHSPSRTHRRLQDADNAELVFDSSHDEILYLRAMLQKSRAVLNEQQQTHTQGHTHMDTQTTPRPRSVSPVPKLEFGVQTHTPTPSQSSANRRRSISDMSSSISLSSAADAVFHPNTHTHTQTTPQTTPRQQAVTHVSMATSPFFRHSTSSAVAADTQTTPRLPHTPQVHTPPPPHLQTQYTHTSTSPMLPPPPHSPTGRHSPRSSHTHSPHKHSSSSSSSSPRRPIYVQLSASPRSPSPRSPSPRSPTSRSVFAAAGHDDSIHAHTHHDGIADVPSPSAWSHHSRTARAHTPQLQMPQSPSAASARSAHSVYTHNTQTSARSTHSHAHSHTQPAATSIQYDPVHDVASMQLPPPTATHNSNSNNIDASIHAVHDEDDGAGLFDSDYNSHTASSDEDRVIIEHLRSKLNEAYKEIRRHEHSHASTHASTHAGSNKPMSPQRLRAAAGSSSSAHKHHHHHLHGQGQDQQLQQGEGSDPNDDVTMKTSDIHMRTPHTQGDQHGHHHHHHHHHADSSMQAVTQEAEAHIHLLSSLLEQSNAKCVALEAQIQNMPGSLHIAHAELRLLDAKLAKALSASKEIIEEKEKEFEKERGELKAFLALSNSEKEALQKKIQEQALTIHQLTLHVQLLQAKAENMTYSSTSIGRDRPAITLGGGGGGGVTVAPAPWDRTSMPVSPGPRFASALTASEAANTLRRQQQQQQQQQMGQTRVNPFPMQQTHGGIVTPMPAFAHARAGGGGPNSDVHAAVATDASLLSPSKGFKYRSEIANELHQQLSRPPHHHQHREHASQQPNSARSLNTPLDTSGGPFFNPSNTNDAVANQDSTASLRQNNAQFERLTALLQSSGIGV
jgi:hypothetical protein